MATATATKRRVKTYEERRDAGELSYEEICDHSRSKVEDIDGRRWEVGDDACAIETKYGDHDMQEMAKDIGMNKSTLAGWKRVADFYPNIVRRKLLDEFPNLTYSHYKDALRCKELDEAINWLELCSTESWSPDKASYELTVKIGKEPQPPAIPGTITDVFKRDGSCIVEITIGLDDMAAMQSGTAVSLKVKEL